jgi:hypothetical protein
MRGFLDFGDADSVEQIITTRLGSPTQEPRAGDQQAFAARVAVEPLQQSTKYLDPANKCCKRHTASAAVPKFFAFQMCQEPISKLLGGVDRL